MTRHDDISVIIPIYNGAPALFERTLASVRSQTLQPLEILVVDDGSTPPSQKILTEIAVNAGAKVLRCAGNQGPARARNYGAAAAKGHWLAFLDADDRWSSEKLALQHALAVRTGNDRKLVLCRTERVRVDGCRLEEIHFDGPMSAFAFAERLLYRGTPLHSFTSSLFLSAKAFRRHGGFDTALRYREDHLFLLRAVLELGWVAVPKILSTRLVHADSTTSAATSVQDLYARQTAFAERASAIAPWIEANRIRAEEARRLLRKALKQRDWRAAGWLLAAYTKASAHRVATRRPTQPNELTEVQNA